jgi:hypothetical protein
MRTTINTLHETKQDVKLSCLEMRFRPVIKSANKLVNMRVVLKDV